MRTINGKYEIGKNQLNPHLPKVFKKRGNVKAKNEIKILSPEEWLNLRLNNTFHSLINSGRAISDLEEVRNRINSRSEFCLIKTESPAMIVLQFLKQMPKTVENVKEVNGRITNSEEVWEFAKTYYGKIDKTTVTHWLNKYVCLGILNSIDIGHENIQYYVDDGFYERGGFNWFFEHSIPGLFKATKSFKERLNHKYSKL